MTKYAKVKITGTLEVITGLHIGTGAGFAAIGATDLPVVKDPLTHLPLIPGSSLKGKMRSLLARQIGSDEGKVYKDPNHDAPKIRRLFGDSKDYMTARLVFSDTKLSNADELERKGAKTRTEVKFENTIDRVTAVANPRQVERVIAGSKFDFQMVYEIAGRQRDAKAEPEFPTADEIKEDFATIVDGLKLLELDYLGGHGSRGYGRVQFHGLKAEPGIGAVDSALLKELNDGLAAL
jgi:CRISPR-associated protein Csm3